jgi:predicted nucleic acid-binding protein
VSFIDTNVLVYATAEGAPFQGRARTALMDAAREAPLAISRQILREYIAVVTRPQTWGRPLSVALAVGDAGTFADRFRLLEDSPAVWETLRELSRTFEFAGRQVHDANVVATMLAHGQRRLLTFNVSDFRRFDAVIELLSP